MFHLPKKIPSRFIKQNICYLFKNEKGNITLSLHYKDKGKAK
ncbi:hypothetical protein HMPREF9442_01301 [Paraprevotella xylaniphila YIT 11841]|uniref:Uncharacterized protein n=1 Tax=Paraprevotella xylaniphila YIT 11841 TaxID=762982 RepID=F3QSY6_9BACT|nr:hypothetical protein HMPREF9442_01301 [Paraprevotella xylaniphila YIT 11841]